VRHLCVACGSAYVYKHTEKLDMDKRACGWLPLVTSCSMTSSSGGQIGVLCAESYCKRILSEGNDVIIVLLRMNREFVEHMREI